MPNANMISNPTPRQALERVHRQEYGQLLATLIGWLGDLELAEEAVQDAFVAALEHWERSGVPHKPGAWLTTTARRKAIDRLRRTRATALDPHALEAQLAVTENFDEIGEIPDDRLKLIFTCCHPALPLEHQIALTLHTLGGLTTPEIAAAFLVPVPTMAQRLVRAKRKIQAAGIPFALQSGYEGYVPKIRVVLWEAAMAAANGLGFDAALSSITLGAAKIIGVADRVGSLEVGKDGDVALFDGDPFEFTTHCVGTIINGALVAEGEDTRSH